MADRGDREKEKERGKNRGKDKEGAEIRGKIEMEEIDRGGRKRV